VFGIVLVTQTVGLILAVGLAVLAREPLPTAVDVAWSVAAGFLGAIGITALYRGLAVGRMSVVAPVTGVLAAALPVVVGILGEGLPAGTVLVGIGLAFAAVVLVSRVSDDGGRSGGLGLAVIAGTAIGVFNVTLTQVAEGSVFWPLAIMRVSQVGVIVVAVLATRSAWRMPGGLVPRVAVVGVLDMAGNTFFLLAAQSGALAIAATLSSLYPVTTAILAATLLRERIAAAHAVGIAAAGVAIALIASGSG
jgi:drug/metabolite transporter (DMT)-like permease